MEQILVSLPDQLLKKIEKDAKMLGVSRSEWIRTMLLGRYDYAMRRRIDEIVKRHGTEG